MRTGKHLSDPPTRQTHQEIHSQSDWKRDAERTRNCMGERRNAKLTDKVSEVRNDRSNHQPAENSRRKKPPERQNESGM